MKKEKIDINLVDDVHVKLTKNQYRELCQYMYDRLLDKDDTIATDAVWKLIIKFNPKYGG